MKKVSMVPAGTLCSVVAHLDRMAAPQVPNPQEETEGSWGGKVYVYFPDDVQAFLPPPIWAKLSKDIKRLPEKSVDEEGGEELDYEDVSVMVAVCETKPPAQVEDSLFGDMVEQGSKYGFKGLGPAERTGPWWVFAFSAGQV